MSEDPHLRVSQAERDAAVDALRGHAAEGRLEIDELEERIEHALTARTRGDLHEPFADLPAAPARRRPRKPVPRPAALLLAVALVAGVVFALTGAAGWVMWTALGWGLFSLKSGRLMCAGPPRRRHSTA